MLKHFIVVVVGIAIFLVLGLSLERSLYFGRIKEKAREKSVPMGFLDYGYGAVGSILKKLSVIRVIPKDDQFDTTKAMKESAVLKIDVQTEGDEKFQVYWADESHYYDEKRSNTIFLRMTENDYYLNLSSLKEIKWIRIDPTHKPSKMRIKEISIEQEGYEPIRFKKIEDFKKIIPLNDIGEISCGTEGITLTASGNDSHFEILIDTKESNEPKKKIINEILFAKKRQITENLYTVNMGRADEFPSSKVASKELIRKDVPLLSVVTEEDSLHGEKRGIIHNWWQRGEKWERLAYVSYYESGKLQLATSAGLRLHGGSTRKAGINFRLYFRKKYGMKEIEPGMIFGSNTQPIKRLVIASDRSNPRFNNCIALEIARKAGCVTPEIKPVYFILNGTPPVDIAYFIIENLTKKQWISHIGHDDFIFLRLRNKNNPAEDQMAYDQLQEKYKNIEHVTLDEVSKEIDIKNLSRFIIATVFCGNWDNVQGAAILNKKIMDPKWFWVMWDMDASFLNDERMHSEQDLWEQRGFLVVHQNEFRMTIFRRLMKESPEYQQYFLKLFMDTLNHLINTSFLESRVKYYERISEAMFGQTPYFDSNVMRKFMEKRPAFLRYELNRYYGDIFSVGESFSCTVNGASGVTYRIDGYSEKPGYRGWYFKGHTIDIQIEKPSRQNFSHWIVNGEKISDPHLIYPVNRETTIEPVFES